MVIKFLYKFNASARNAGRAHTILNHGRLVTNHRYDLAICIYDCGENLIFDTQRVYEAFQGFVDSSLEGSVFVCPSLKPDLMRCFETVQARVVNVETNEGVSCNSIASYIHKRVDNILHSNPKWFEGALVFQHQVKLLEDDRLLCETDWKSVQFSDDGHNILEHMEEK